MVTQLESLPKPEVIYPDSDGEPMSDNTQQFELIVWIKDNLELLFASNNSVFVAGDLLWYPVEGNNLLRQAPDVMVAFGRPKGYRGSYQQWLEANIPPQVVFEIWSPGNRPSNMARKLDFYARYGVEEYYLYKPDLVDLTGWQRAESGLELIEQIEDWVSPRLGVRLKLAEERLEIYRPDGQPFLTYLELAQLKEEAESRAQSAESRAEEAESRAQSAESMLEEEKQRSQSLEAKLRELGINPNQL